MPKVSIIIPVYGVERFIERCARSLFEQTLEDIEYIFVNDCTPDRSMDILQEVIKDYPHRIQQIRIENMPTNSGQAAVRRHGIQLATGDYIIHCDSDDWVETSMYELLYDKAIEEDLDFVSCDYDEIKGDAATYIKCESICNREAVISDLIAQRIAVSTCNKLIRKEIYDKNPIVYPTHNMGEDLALTLQLAIYSKKFGHIKSALYHYSLNQNSISNQNSIDAIEKRWADLKMNVQIVIDCVCKQGLSKNFKPELVSLKRRYKNRILPLAMTNEKYRKMWMNTYPEINIWTEPGIRNKIRHLFLNWNLYPLYRKLKNFT